jgi:hypothetical protein
VHLNARIACGALQLGVAQQEWHGSKDYRTAGRSALPSSAAGNACHHEEPGPAPRPVNRTDRSACIGAYRFLHLR